MKRVHRDCFIASEMVDFLVVQGLAESRKKAVEIGRLAVEKKLICQVLTGISSFCDSYHYYRFTEDGTLLLQDLKFLL